MLFFLSQTFSGSLCRCVTGDKTPPPPQTRREGRLAWGGGEDGLTSLGLVVVGEGPPMTVHGRGQSDPYRGFTDDTEKIEV